MTEEPLSITLETVTPIWTGGAEGKADRLHTTGIMGSLRWWYEALVRGVGGNGCDPTQHACMYKDELPDQGLCDVCRVFGATGWSRRFRLMVENEDQLQPEKSPNLKISAARSYVRGKGGVTKTITPTWYFKGPALRDKVDIRLIATEQKFQIQIIGGLMQFIADWASIGAKPQMGFGVVEITPRQDVNSLIEHLQSIAGTNKEKKLPALDNMFFASISAGNLATSRNPVQETFNLKYDLRCLFATDPNLRHFVMGTVKGERRGAKIMMSRPYSGNTIRLWGWIPEEVSRFGAARVQVLDRIYKHLSTHYALTYWREFDSPRDTNRCNDIFQFLQSFGGK